MNKKLLLLSLISLLFFTHCSKNDVAAPNDLNYKSVGLSARELLSAEKYQSVNLQILYMPGYRPDATALNNLVNFLNTLINKPAGIQVVYTSIAASGKATLNLDEIRAIEKNNRTVFTSGSALGICLLYTDGDYYQPNTLGIAHLNTSMAIFGKTVHDNSGGVNQPSLVKLETTVTEHEFGHLLGLVALGSPMQVNHKETTTNTNHCNNSACLMYFSTTTMGGILLSGPVPGLDTNCKNDLTANGGK
jgi:predicted Zn-dependent protease